VTWQAAQALEEGPYAKKREFDLPLREQSIIVTDHGFYPETIAVFKGERVRFFVTSTSDNKSCFILKGKNLFLAAEKGKVSEGEVLFKEPQVVEYYCPTLKTKGHITVLERPQDKQRRRAQRTMASEKVRIWMPREE
jgi:plastocyanin